MKFFFRTKKNMKFLLKIQYDDGDALINKLAPILNQMAIEETTLLDDFLFSFYNHNYQEELEAEDLTATLYHTIWKNRNLFHQLKIKPIIFYEFLFKYYKDFFEERKFFYQTHNKKTFFIDPLSNMSRGIFISLYFILDLLEATFRNSDLNFIFQPTKFDEAHFCLFGVRKSYSKREEMLGRKINFRRKLQKKKFEEYQV